MGAPVEQIDPPKDNSNVDSEAGRSVQQARGGVDHLGMDMPDVGGASDKGKDDTKVDGDAGKGKDDTKVDGDAGKGSDVDSSNGTPGQMTPPAGGPPRPATPPAGGTPPPPPATPPAGGTPPPNTPPGPLNAAEIRGLRKVTIEAAANGGFTAAEFGGLRSGTAFTVATEAHRAQLALSADQIMQLSVAASANSESGERVSAAEIDRVLDGASPPNTPPAGGSFDPDMPSTTN